MAQIQEFAFVGVRNMLIKDKTTKAVLCELPYLVGFNLSDQQDVEYLRGGFERLKLLPFKGDRNTSVTVTTATSSPDLLRLQLGTEFESVENHSFDKEENLTSTTGSFTLSETPADGASVTVYAVDAVGSKTELKPAEGESPESGEYAISGTTITTDASVTSIRVLYVVKQAAQVLKAKNVDTATYEISGILVAQEVGTGKLYAAQVDIPSGVIQLNSQMDASNEGGVPDNIEFTIDMLSDATKDYTYMIAFKEQI